MIAKRALVVDDSKSARAFLARLLQDQQLEVDAAETAEQAIDYLAQNRPDVIFMDHLMPGMDGFQAVQAIKGNPRTATIPILMYTSQEGELYLGQARALGAAGVLSKSVAPTDVRTVLQQLQLVAQPEPPVAAQPQAPAVAAATAAVVAEAPAPVAAPGPSVEELLHGELAALRQQLAEALAAHGQQVLGEVRGLIRELPAPPMAAPVEPEKPRHSPWPWLLAVAASVVAAVFGTLQWQGQQQLDTLRSELADSRSMAALLAARLGPAPQAATVGAEPLAESTSTDTALVLRVPFGEAPLAGARVDALRGFVARVAALAQKGTVEVRRYTGRFCLAGSGTAGYALADGATPYINCDLVADATDPVLGGTGPESAAFTSLLAELRKQHAALLTIDVGVAGSDAPGNAYPEVGGTPPRVPTAAEWNAVALGNNRVEIRWHPAT
jgi:CheY-like chemotaxis protein